MFSCCLSGSWQVNIVQRVIEKGGETGEGPWFVWYFDFELSLKISLKHDVSPTWQSVLLGIKQGSFLSSDLKNWADTRFWLWVAFIKNFEQKALRSDWQVFRYFGYDFGPAAAHLIIINIITWKRRFLQSLKYGRYYWCRLCTHKKILQKFWKKYYCLLMYFRTFKICVLKYMNFILQNFF